MHAVVLSCSFSRDCTGCDMLKFNFPKETSMWGEGSVLIAYINYIDCNLFATNTICS